MNLNLTRLCGFCLPVLSLVLTSVSAQRGSNPAPLIAAAADADRNGEVSTSEWTAFLASFQAGQDGALNRAIVKARLVMPALDRSGDGALVLGDLLQIFTALDSDGDGSLQSSEVGGGGRRGGRRRGGGGNNLVNGVVTEAADADTDGSVSAAEWSSFLAALPGGPTDPIPPTTVAEWIKKAEANIPEDRTAFTTATYLLTLDSNLDVDRNGAVTAADLDQALTNLDQNADRTLQTGEINPPAAARGRGGARGQRGGGRRGQRGGGGRGQRGGGWGRVTKESKAMPPLMPWQRNLDDALAMVAATGKPLLIAVNMDDEPASEGLAWARYRNPEFVQLASGFIPVLASPDQRNPREYDDHGRRIADWRFGRLLNSEHIDIEPILFERYFQGQRVAPRHLAIDKDGKVLFDIYLSNDLTIIDTALRDHGKPDGRGPQPAVESLDVDTLLRSPDAAHRDRLEEMFSTVDETTRASLAARALTGSVHHPELLRLALRDPSVGVRHQAVRTIAQRPDRTPLQMFPEVIRAADGDPALGSLLVDALHRMGTSTADEDTRARARVLRQHLLGFHLRSGLIDLTTWNTALQSASRSDEPPLASVDLDELGDRLDNLQQQRRTAADDHAINLEIAAATMRYARVVLEQGGDPTFHLEDVTSAARRATSAATPNGTALGYLAWASHLAGRPEDAGTFAAQALPHLLESAGTPMVAEVLNAFAFSRTKALYDAMGQGLDWPSSWVADIHAAYEALVRHPNCTEAQIISYLNWLNALETYAPQPAVLSRALELFPISGDIHEQLRFQVLRDAGARALEQTYARMTPSRENRSTIGWFAGLASLVAAEQDVQNQQPDDALATYERSIQQFQAAIEESPNFAASANHYVCLAKVGRGRLFMSTKQWGLAIEEVRDGIALSPTSATTADGSGQTPTDTAKALHSALAQAGLETEASTFQEAVSSLGVIF